MKNFYRALGVRSVATLQEIKAAFREKAKQFHPDVNPGNSEALIRFTEINEAYETLSDEAKRKAYDERLSAINAASSGGSSGASEAFKKSYNQSMAFAEQAQQQGYKRGYAEASESYSFELERLRRQYSNVNDMLSREEGKTKELEEQLRRARTGRSERVFRSDSVAQKDAASGSESAAQKDTASLEFWEKKGKALEDEEKKLNDDIKGYKTKIAELTDRLSRFESHIDDSVSAENKARFDWQVKLNADRMQAKNTLYEALGALCWSTKEEISENYNKLVKCIQAGELTKEKKAKLYEINDAFRVLKNDESRALYNISIGVTEDMIAANRKQKNDYDFVMAKYNGVVTERQFVEYVEKLTKKADGGDPEAQNTLGEMYYYGDELEKNDKAAVFYFKESAKQHYPAAIFNLGVCFIKGDGVLKDDVKGLSFIKQAAKLNVKEAINFLSK